jgi:hypothetical protein
MLFFLRLGNSAAVVTPTTPRPLGGGGHHYLPHQKRKFTKKDEKELKKLLLEIVEDDSYLAQRKAQELASLENAATGIRNAVNDAQKSIRKQALSQRLEWQEAQRRIKELDEEEDLLLLIAIL